MKRRYRLIVVFMMAAAAVFSLFFSNSPAFAQGTPTPVEIDSGLTAAQIIGTILYGLLGVVLFLLSYFVFDRFMKLDLRRELVEDQNESIGIMMAGMFIGIAIIIAAAIAG